MSAIRVMQRGLVLVLADKGGQACYGALGELGEIVEVHQLEEAAALCERSEAVLMIVDCGCDADEGLRLLCDVKQRRFDLPVIFVTDASSEEVVTRAFKAGAREYFRKPLDMAEFTAAAGKILAFKRENHGKPLSLATAENGGVPAPLQISPDLPEQLMRSIHYMELNLAKPVCLENIAREACLSKYHFCRMFTKHVGLSPIQFMLNLRICQATFLLCCTEFPISRVALRSGYNDLSEFNKHFKKVTGVTPSAYRKSARSKE